MKGIFCKISSTIRCLSAKQLAEAIFQLLVSAFDDYAEGYNYLGLIALEQRQYKKLWSTSRKPSLSVEICFHVDFLKKTTGSITQLAHSCEA